jgi:hypothetical protein
METVMDVRMAACVCGKVQFRALGSPTVNSVCHCDDCQAGALEIEALLHASPMLDEYGGTPFTVYRDDRFSCVQGAELLQGHKLNEQAPTTRYVASCCNSAMYLKYAPGWWKSVYRGRFADALPPPEMRYQIEHLPAGVERPTDLPTYKGFPQRLLRKLIMARIAMAFGRLGLRAYPAA